MPHNLGQHLDYHLLGVWLAVTSIVRDRLYLLLQVADIWVALTHSDRMLEGA